MYIILKESSAFWYDTQVLPEIKMMDLDAIALAL